MATIICTFHSGSCSALHHVLRCLCSMTGSRCNLYNTTIGENINTILCVSVTVHVRLHQFYTFRMCVHIGVWVVGGADGSGFV